MDLTGGATRATCGRVHNVSGDPMVKARERGWIEEERIVDEC